MSHQPTQRSLLQDIVAELVTANAAIAAQAADLATQTAEIQAQTLAIVAMQADIAAQLDSLVKTKEFTRWQNEYLAGSSTDLDAIEAGTHTFPSAP